MKVLLTGAGGFVGTHLVQRLRQDCDLVLIDRDLAMYAPAPGLRLIAGDLAEPGLMADSIQDGIDAVLHLASLPGGAAEADPALSQRVNLVASLDLLAACAALPNVPRVVYASSIAAYGEALPQDCVSDATRLAPNLIYGAHKAMVEIMVATHTRRGAIDGMSLRLPGIIARPQAALGLKSAFMSDVLHALRAGRGYVAPVSAGATLWLMSVACCVDNLVHALGVRGTDMPADRALTLPALRLTMGELVAEASAQCGVTPQLVTYAPDGGIEAAFGAHPPLTTAKADRLGFRHDGRAGELVRSAYGTA